MNIADAPPEFLESATDEFVDGAENTVKTDFLVPSLPEKQDVSMTYVSPVPKSVQQGSEPCILGVDEAGRGPVIGPMVYAIAYCPKSFDKELKSYGFADSKTLTAEKRSNLMKSLCQDDDKLISNVGWATTSMSAQDISSGMLRPLSSGNYNLNEQAHDATIALVKKVLDTGINATELYVDTVGPPQKYQDKLSRIFPSLKVTVTKKADSIYPVVSAASVCAKVTRDQCIMQDEIEWGSGYPSDPNTVKWLEANVDRFFGWNHMIRYSWQTTKDIMERKKCISTQWADEFYEQNMKVTSYFGKENKNIHFDRTMKNSIGNLGISTRYLGHSVVEL